MYVCMNEYRRVGMNVGVVCVCVCRLVCMSEDSSVAGQCVVSNKEIAEKSHVNNFRYVLIVFRHNGCPVQTTSATTQRG